MAHKPKSEHVPPALMPSFCVHCPHLSAGTGPQGSGAPSGVLDFNAAGEYPKALRHFLIADLPAGQAWNSANQRCPVPKPTGPPSAASLAWPLPGRLVEWNCANMKFLDLINGANGEGAVVGQCQAGKKGLGLD